jgi:hypothetical protein
MLIADVSFDAGQGDANISLDAGVFAIKAVENNPNFPSNLQINLPIDVVFAAIEAKANSTLVSWTLKVLAGLLDAIP